MINILQFRELCIELQHKVNAISDNPIDTVVMAVREEHMVKKLQNKLGITLCVSYPDAQSSGTEDNYTDNQQAFFFVVKRLAPGQLDDETEITTYAELQDIMLNLRDVIRDYYSECMGIIPEEIYKIEWEYQIFGGVNGLSMGVTFQNND
ncbi:hypothetical protein [uncultured Bacteroides sp.]|uniref:hypothetical protein n=1 Tax=uncultured Bacteroides sp. TaxID=162156 RepID=UPI002598C961|nr:hypothetical protein [uncultured Bacteroides sp.]